MKRNFVKLPLGGDFCQQRMDTDAIMVEFDLMTRNRAKRITQVSFPFDLKQKYFACGDHVSFIGQLIFSVLFMFSRLPCLSRLVPFCLAFQFSFSFTKI